MEVKNADRLTLWIQNKQLIESIKKNNKEIESLQQDIIRNVFGNFQKLLQFLLRNVITLTIEKHQLLHNTLTNHVIDDNDIDKNSKSLIATLPNDLLSYTMKFLEQNDRYIIQQCCRLFAITARKESSVNTIYLDLPLMGITPYISTIIDGIQSDDNNLNLKSLQLYKTYMYRSRTDINWDLKAYDHNDNLFNKFLKLVNQHKSTELGQKIAVKIFGFTYDEPKISVFEGIRYALQDNFKIIYQRSLKINEEKFENFEEENVERNENKNAENDDCNPIYSIFETLSNSDIYIDGIIKCDGLLDEIFNILNNYNILTFYSRDKMIFYVMHVIYFL